MPRPRRVIEIGAGVSPRKALSLASRHPKTHFTAVELQRISMGHGLRQIKGFQKPANLEVRDQINARRVLERSPANHYSHAYSYFVLENMAWVDRVHVLHQVYRTLQPGATYSVLSAGAYERTFVRELMNAGFKVTTRPLSADKVEKMGSDDTESHAQLVRQGMTFVGYRKANAETKQLLEEGAREVIRNWSRKHNGPDASRGAKLAEREALEDVAKTFTRSFVLLTARKPRK